MISEPGLANIDVQPKGVSADGQPEPYVSRSDMNKLVQILEHCREHGLPITDKHRAAWVDMIEKAMKCKSHRVKIAAGKLLLAGEHFNLKMAENAMGSGTGGDGPGVSIQLVIRPPRSRATL